MHTTTAATATMPMPVRAGMRVTVTIPSYRVSAVAMPVALPVALPVAVVPLVPVEVVRAGAEGRNSTLYIISRNNTLYIIGRNNTDGRILYRGRLERKLSILYIIGKNSTASLPSL
jgi:hypothetical protein